jgi:hypothetical protein
MNLRKIALSLVLSFIVFVCETNAQVSNVLTKEEIEDGWQLLFNGKNLDGWRKLAESGWEVKEEELLAVPSDINRQMDIVTIGEYDHFELYFEFKVFNMTNSGIKYWVSNDYSERKSDYLGLEYQILDDDNFVYPERGIFRSTSALYDLIPAHKDRPIVLGEWNTARIIVNDGCIQHWLNGTKILEFDPNTDAFKSLVMQSKYKNFRDFGKTRKGSILLQNEGTPVSFRNLKIKALIQS